MAIEEIGLSPTVQPAGVVHAEPPTPLATVSIVCKDWNGRVITQCTRVFGGIEAARHVHAYICSKLAISARQDQLLLVALLSHPQRGGFEPKPKQWFELERIDKVVFSIKVNPFALSSYACPIMPIQLQPDFSHLVVESHKQAVIWNKIEACKGLEMWPADRLHYGTNPLLSLFYNNTQFIRFSGCEPRDLRVITMKKVAAPLPLLPTRYFPVRSPEGLLQPPTNPTSSDKVPDQLAEEIQPQEMLQAVLESLTQSIAVTT